MVDVGAGLPLLATAAASVMVRPWLQAGVGYGFSPFKSDYKPDVDIQRIEMSLADGNTYTLVGRPLTSFSMLHPYVRVFPTENNFYFQLGVNFFKVSTTISGDLKQGDDVAISDALKINVSFIQPMATLSIGRMFIGKIYVINFSLGASVFLNGWADVALDSALPISVGADVLNEGALNQAKAQAAAAAQDVSKELRKQFLFLPSIYLSIGFVI